MKIVKIILSAFIGMVVLFCFFGLLIDACTDEGDNESSSKSDVNAKTEVLDIDPRQTTIDNLNAQIERFEKGMDWDGFKSSFEGLESEVMILSSYANTIEAAQMYDTLTPVINDFKRKIATVQKKEYPAMRKAAATIFKDKLWVEDIEVSINGTGNTIINFSGGIFAANRNKQEFQQEVQELLKKLRFKEARYRWYKEDNEYTYWKLETPKDEELVKYSY
ncbi:hypothetical protein BFP77_08255 [Maribacter sp. 4U21]|uniref:hypothetical protein n=1 Tax=Maribacter sp. 4U21 TaxID=1889779 RepID=UPI000C146382|nr:hypothetical protein [Maribacter sp. 4U21]PIB28899.1 hypothetical protein BFP77_08255 [Maribacter sp. 4U21]